MTNLSAIKNKIDTFVEDFFPEILVYAIIALALICVILSGI